MSSEHGWWQQTLTPPEVYEATIKIGIVPSTDHGQVWWEVADPMTRVVIAQGSNPHCRVAQVRPSAEIILDRLLTELEALIEPF